MKNLKKRKCIAHDTNFLGPNEPLKKYKINGSTCESQSAINWHQVKIILDATVVEKYLNNKSSNGEILATPISNTRTMRDKTVVPFVTQANKVFSSVLSGMKDVMVKLENLEDISYDNSKQKEDDEFANAAPVKQEEHIINGDEFEESTWDNFHCRNFENDASCTEQFIKGVFNNVETVSGRCHEELTIGSEFKNEEFIANHENPELIISQENVDASKETSPRRITRSNRQKKKCQDCNVHLNPKVVKKLRIPSRVEKKSIENLNCSNKSKKKTMSKPNPLQPPANPQPQSKINESYCCDNCNKNFKSKGYLRRHIFFCSYPSLLKCKYCPVPIKSKNEIRKHLETAHIDRFPARIKQSFINEFWIKSLKDVVDKLEREGDTEKLSYFVTKFLHVAKYWAKRRDEIIKLYCTNCSKTCKGNIFFCPTCKSKLLYQCQHCNTTRSSYFAIYAHLYRKGSRCIVSNRHPLDTDEEPLNTRSEATSSDEPCEKYYNCKLCGYKWTRKSQLYKHIFKHMKEKNNKLTCSKCGTTFSGSRGKPRFKYHEEFCGVSVPYPCLFCPRTIYRKDNLGKHIAWHHAELINMNAKDILKCATTFKKMIQTINKARFDEKMKREKVAGEMIDDANYYLAGMQSILRPVCLQCNATVAQPYNVCVECRTSLIYQCLQCDEYFTKYFIAWNHVTCICENRILTLPEHVRSINDNILAYIDNPRHLGEPSHLVDHSYALVISSSQSD